MDYFGKIALVIGLGVSGAGAGYALKKTGATVLSVDERENKIDFNSLGNVDLIVISPSVPAWHEAYSFASMQGIEIIGELELGFRLWGGKIIAVTGTNGKTTTVSLIGEMLKNDNKSVDVCGNIGKSFAGCAVDSKSDFTALEVSSFQLESAVNLKPDIAIITNIAVDHLDRHGTKKNYADIKLSIAKNQDKNDFLILPYEDIECGFLTDFCPASQVVFVSPCQKVYGAYALKNKIYYMGEYILDVSAIKMQGKHNLINTLFAVAAAKLSGVKNEAIVKTLVSFSPDNHRLKFVDTAYGKNYYNDSKGTNISATLAACESMDGDTLLILGGSDKGYDYDELFFALPKQIVKIYVIGETSKKILDSAKKADYKNIVLKASLPQCVIDSSGENEIINVLLSPAAASFDMFKDYKHRGGVFEAEVMKLKG